MTRALGTPHRGQITVVDVVLLAMIVLCTLDSQAGQRVRAPVAPLPGPDASSLPGASVRRRTFTTGCSRDATALPEALDQAGQVRWQGRVELQAPIVDWMAKCQTAGVQRLAREGDRARAIRPVDISLFAHKH